MERRNFLLGLAALCAAPGSGQAAEPPKKTMRVAIFEGTSLAKSQSLGQDKLFVEAMRELGWVEGRNVVYDRVYGNDELSGPPALASTLVASQPDVVFVRSTQPALAASAATRTIPIVFFGVSDPEERGLVKSLARPGGNVTGVTPVGPDLGGKRLQLVKQAMPGLTRMGVLVNPSYSPTSSKDYKMIQAAASSRGVTVIPAMLSSADELDAAFEALTKSRIEALIITQNPLFNVERKRILSLAAGRRIPVMGNNSDYALDGALLSYSADRSEQIRGVAQMVDKILKGAKPSGIPVEQPTRFELVVNLKTAKTLGITIPESVLLQAARVIE